MVCPAVIYAEHGTCGVHIFTDPCHLVNEMSMFRVRMSPGRLIFILLVEKSIVMVMLSTFAEKQNTIGVQMCWSRPTLVLKSPWRMILSSLGILASVSSRQA